MDKWEQAGRDFLDTLKRRDEEAALTILVRLAVDFGRALETVSSDLDRIATALEAANGS